MKILVTGGSGFIGANLIRYLFMHTGHAVTNVDKLTYAAHVRSLEDLHALIGQDHSARLTTRGLNERYEFIQADVADARTLRDVFERARPDAVVHLAAESHVDRSIDCPAAFIQTNVVGTFCLLEASHRYWSRLSGEAQERFRFVHVSSDEVYGSLGDAGRFSETTPYDPHSPYAASKASSDHLAGAWHRTYGLPVIITNCSNNYGPYQYPEKLIPHVILKALRNEPLPVYGRGKNVRDWLHVEDHVRGLLTVLERGRPGEKYNLGGFGERRNIDLVQTLCEILDESRPRSNGLSYAWLVQFVADRPGHDYRYAIDASKIQRELGWQPQYSLEQGLRSTVEWYLANATWWEGILKRGYQMERLGTGAGGRL